MKSRVRSARGERSRNGQQAWMKQLQAANNVDDGVARPVAGARESGPCASAKNGSGATGVAGLRPRRLRTSFPRIFCNGAPPSN